MRSRLLDRHFRLRFSVRLKATLAVTVVVAVALGIAVAVLVSALGGSLANSAAAEATRRAQTAADLVSVEKGPGLPPGAALPDVQFLDEAGVAVHPITGATDSVDVWEPSGSYVLATESTRTPEGVVLVRARASLAPSDSALATLRTLLLPGVPALLLLVAGLTWFAVGRALAPVSAISREMADITATDLHRRVPVPRARDEIARLAETTNRTLDRLEGAVGRHQRFVADAAHELRSPLAILRARLELAPAQPLTTEALTDVDRIQRLTADLLLLARLDAAEPPGRGEVDLGQVAAEEAGRARPRRDVRVALQISSGVIVRGSTEELRRLVTNLVDNAVRHAAREVRVSLAVAGGEAVLEISDDGKGIPHEHQETVFNRFTRLDEARTRDAGGSGLGLAIARDIAARHGGDLAIVPAKSGTRLRARMPIG